MLNDEIMGYMLTNMYKKNESMNMSHNVVKPDVSEKEALEILAPIAHHLGIHKIKSELEDLALRYLKPDVFYDIAERLNKTKIERVETLLEQVNINKVQINQKLLEQKTIENKIQEEIDKNAEILDGINAKINELNDNKFKYFGDNDNELYESISIAFDMYLCWQFGDPTASVNMIAVYYELIKAFGQMFLLHLLNIFYILLILLKLSNF